jgi:hypothetical protein
MESKTITDDSKKINKIRQLTNKLLTNKLNQESKEQSDINSDAQNLNISNIDLLFSINNTINRKINNEIKLIKTDRKTLNRLADILKYKSDSNIKSANKFSGLTAIKDPFARKDGNGDSGLGFLGGLLGLGKLFVGKIFKTLSKPLIKILKKLGIKIAKLSGRLAIKSGGWIVKKTGGVTKKIIQKIGRSVVGRAGSAIAQRLGMGAAVTAAEGTAGAIAGGGVATAAGVTALGAVVGYSSYKLGRYFKLSEKLDDFINNKTSGKYRDLADIIIGTQDGEVGKDISDWFKEKTDGFFEKAFDFIKTKTYDLLKKLTPWSSADNEKIAKNKIAAATGKNPAAIATISQSQNSDNANITNENSNPNAENSTGFLGSIGNYISEKYNAVKSTAGAGLNTLGNTLGITNNTLTGTTDAINKFTLSHNKGYENYDGQCATNVKNALSSAGYKYVPGHGKDTADAMYKGNPGKFQYVQYSANYTPQIGDVMSTPSYSSPQYGHVAVYTSKGWWSGGVQKPRGKNGNSGAPSEKMAADILAGKQWAKIIRPVGGNKKSDVAVDKSGSQPKKANDGKGAGGEVKSASTPLPQLNYVNTSKYANLSPQNSQPTKKYNKSSQILTGNSKNNAKGSLLDQQKSEVKSPRIPNFSIDLANNSALYT